MASKRNNEGYADPTAYLATKNIERAERTRRMKNKRKSCLARQKKNKALIGLILLMILFSILNLGAVKSKTEVEEPENTPEMIDIRAYWDEHPEEYTRLSEIHDMALTAGKICPEGASDQCISAVMYVIYNRYKTAGFPNTISEVCSQTNQWQFLNDTHITPRLRQLAKANLDLWEGGEPCVLPCNRNVLYFDATDNGFAMRSVWNGDTEQVIPFFDGK